MANWTTYTAAQGFPLTTRNEEHLDANCRRDPAGIPTVQLGPCAAACQEWP